MLFAVFDWANLEILISFVEYLQILGANLDGSVNVSVYIVETLLSMMNTSHNAPSEVFVLAKKWKYAGLSEKTCDYVTYIEIMIQKLLLSCDLAL